MELKHMTSSSGLPSPTKPNRQSQHPRSSDQRLGSPNSIPSSPTSIRSSSSAIFERDIEPIISPSPPITHHHQQNPHRIPRAKATEQLEQSVPSVLDSAAAILAGTGKEDVASEVAVVSPASSFFDVVERTSGFASPIGSLRSRSPSPVGSRVGATSPRSDALLTIPVSPQAPPIIPSPASILGLQNVAPPATLPPKVLRPTVQTAVDTPTSTLTFPPPMSVHYDSAASSRQSSPKTTTLEHFPSPHVPTSIVGAPSYGNPPVASPSSLSSHPPSPLHVPKKRLSFMSYSDLLTSTPATTQTLSSLTTCASATDPPPHIPSVSGLNIASAVHPPGFTNGNSRAPSLRSFPLGAVGVGPTGGVTHPGKRDSIALLDNMGGEWEREGLGKGLDERLDALDLPTSSPLPIGGKV